MPHFESLEGGCDDTHRGPIWMLTGSTAVDGTVGSDGLHRNLQTLHGRSCPPCKRNGQSHRLFHHWGKYCRKTFRSRDPLLAYVPHFNLHKGEYTVYHNYGWTMRGVGIKQSSLPLPTYLRWWFKLQQTSRDFWAWVEITSLYGSLCDGNPRGIKPHDFEQAGLLQNTWDSHARHHQPCKLLCSANLCTFLCIDRSPVF